MTTKTPRAQSTSTRESRAARLLVTGKVQLFVGRGYAVVTGSQGGEYTVTREGCTCKDAETRNRTGCYHALVVKQICEEFKALKAAAERGETVRPSAALMQAIKWPQRATTSPTCQDCGTTISRGRHCTRCLDQQLFGDTPTRETVPCLGCGTDLTIYPGKGRENEAGRLGRLCRDCQRVEVTRAAA